MAKNNKIRVDIDGDSTGLQKALQKASGSLDEFGREAGGIAGDAASTISNSFSKVGMASAGLAGAVAVAGFAIAGTLSKVQQQSEKAFEVFQSASMSQMGIDQIQRMAVMYQSVGLTMEQIADHQKDIKDRIGDALTNQAGSMYTDVIKPLKLNILELQKMADAGEDVYAKIYFAAKEQGMSSSQIVNMFETMGNDATKKLTVLQRFSDEQEYNNKLLSQQVALTGEQSDQFQKYRDSTLALNTAWETWNNSTLAPIAARLADILGLMTKILNSKPVTEAANATGQKGIDAVNEYSKNFQNQVLANSSIYGAALAKDQQEELKKLKESNDAKNAEIKRAEEEKKKVLEGFDKSTIKAAMKPFENEKQATQAKIDALDVQYKQTKEAIEKSITRAYAGDQKAMQADIDKLTTGYEKNRKDLVKKLTAEEDKAAEEAKRKQDKLDSLAKKSAADRLKAETDLQKAISDMTIGNNQRQLAEFERQQKALVDTIKKSAKELGLSQGELNKLLAQQQESANFKRTEMVNGMIGYSDPNQSLKDSNSLISSGSVNNEQMDYLRRQQNERINGDNPFTFNATEQKLKENEEARNLELQQNDLLLKGHEDYEKRKAEITNKYNAQAMQISRQNAQDQLTVFSTAATSLSDGMVAAFGKSSGAAQAAFALQKGITMAQTVLSIQSALAQALATPFPASLAAYAQVLSLGMSIITTAKGAASGQFHGGVDELPASYNNKSFVLKAGERVVQPEANKKLTQFLDNQSSESTTGDIIVNAPLIIQGDVAGDDAKFQEMLKKNANSVTQAVRSSQKRNT